MDKICPQCGKTFINKKHKEAIFCSNKCRGNSVRKVVAETVCEYCGKLTGSDRARFCCRDCYDNHRTESRPLCPHCGQRIKPGRSKGKFCCHECRVSYKKPKPRPCVNCGTTFTPIKYHPQANRYVANNNGKTCSQKCQTEWCKNNPDRKRKISESSTGPKHHNWQGGKSAINLAVHRGSGWTVLAEKVRDRDKRVCTKCGKTEAENGRKMDVHHIVPYHDINDTRKANKLSNLISLCKVCHRKEEHALKGQQIVLPFAKIAQDERRAARMRGSV